MCLSSVCCSSASVQSSKFPASVTPPSSVLDDTLLVDSQMFSLTLLASAALLSSVAGQYTATYDPANMPDKTEGEYWSWYLYQITCLAFVLIADQLGTNNVGSNLLNLYRHIC